MAKVTQNTERWSTRYCDSIQIFMIQIHQLKNLIHPTDSI